jgi:hypothetical protein
MQSKSVSKLSVIAALLAMVYGFSTIAPSARADDEEGRGRGCSNATLHGAYGLTIDATTAPGLGLPFRGVVLQTYDGAGHLTIRDQSFSTVRRKRIHGHPAPVFISFILIAPE